MFSFGQIHPQTTTDTSIHFLFSRLCRCVGHQALISRHGRPQGLRLTPHACFCASNALCCASEPLYGLFFQCLIKSKSHTHSSATITADALICININRALLINYCTYRTYRQRKTGCAVMLTYRINHDILTSRNNFNHAYQL